MTWFSNLTIITLFLFCAGNSFAAQKDNRGLTVKYVRTLPDDGISESNLEHPQALAIDADGNLYVVDTGHNRVVKFDQSGKIVATTGGFGWQNDAFDRPLDVSVKFILDVFVADYNNQRIQRFDRNLNFISTLVVNENQPQNLQFGLPTGVDISKHGELFLCDVENNRVLKINTFGAPVLSFGDFSWGEGRLLSPARIEITPDDQIYVSDKDANDIVVYDYYGNYNYRFGAQFLKRPLGLVWQGGMLFVADSGNNRMVTFDRGGHLIATWGAKGSKIGEFDNPTDVAVHKNLAYVLDSNNNRIQIFELLPRGK